MSMSVRITGGLVSARCGEKFRNNEEVRNKMCALDKNHFVLRNQPA